MTELNIIIDNLYIYVLVFVRTAAVVVFNPIMSRQNIPAMVRTVIVFFTTLLLAPLVPLPDSLDTLSLVLGIVREIAVGWLLGYIFNIFFYMLAFVGDILDMQFGLSMAKVMDPGTGVQSAFTGNLINLIYMAYFFVTNSHLVLIKIAVDSYNLIPAGAENINIYAAAGFGIDVFTSVFSLAVRLAFPFVATEFILEMGMGILMKLIPQIHIFVINMQFKILLAILMLFVLAKPITVFTENYIIIMFDYMNEALRVLVSQ
ncbi:MAG: flagellar biosynthetic protein FliR [Oscillospiraceae bacterium]|nr:flagellar biosynthetic protein FliR [Oscillospiraceae bacterium]